MSPYLIFKIISLTVLVVIWIVVLVSKTKDRHVNTETKHKNDSKNNDKTSHNDTNEKNKERDDILRQWAQWKESHPNVIARYAMFGYGSNTDYSYMLDTIERYYPEWRVIGIEDNKLVTSLGRVGGDEYAIHKSSLTIINRAGETKKIIFHTLGKVLIID